MIALLRDRCAALFDGLAFQFASDYFVRVHAPAVGWIGISSRSLSRRSVGLLTPGRCVRAAVGDLSGDLGQAGGAGPTGREAVALGPGGSAEPP